MGDINGWPPEWLQGGVTPLAADDWRGVEGQHQVATLKLTESIPEQEILEELLWPANRPAARRARIASVRGDPFRYRGLARVSVSPGPLNRGCGAARRSSTACAEVGCWRRRFVSDSDGLSTLQVVSGRHVLSGPPRGQGDQPQRAAVERRACPLDESDRLRRLPAAGGGHPAPACSGSATSRCACPAGIARSCWSTRAISLPEPLEQQTWVFKTSKRAGSP